MDGTKISVVIPVYGTEAYLRECLDSVIAQTLRAIEVIVIIDASPDRSAEVARCYAENDHRIKVIEKPVNEGLPAARNTGVAASAGEYVIHLDSDDFWTDAHMLEALYVMAVSEGCDMLRFNGHEYRAGKPGAPILNTLELVNGRFDEDRQLWCYRSVFLYLFKKSFLDGHGLFFREDITLGEDGIFLSAALSAASSVSSTSASYYAYRIRDSGMMKRSWSLDEFLEEETAAQLVADNISGNDAALQTHLSYRISAYWLNVLCAKLFRDLSKRERMEYYALARENFSRLNLYSSGLPRLNLAAGRVLHRYFNSPDFEKLDRTVRLMGTASSALPVITRLIDFTGRSFGFGIRILKSLQAAFHSVFSVSSGTERSFENIESIPSCCFTLPSRRRTAGVSAMLRVRNEEKRIRACIESIADVFDEIVVIDNGSDDATGEIVNQLSHSEKYGEKIRLFSYPHRVARCGAEHARTPGNSVHSLAYYYNWCVSKCRYGMICKWDADMLLAPDSASAFRSFTRWFVRRKGMFLGVFPVQTVYIDAEGQWYGAESEVNEEIRLFPNTSRVRFTKGESWEELTPEASLFVRRLAPVCVHEVKDVNEDEFSHWSEVRFRGARKALEFRNFNKVRQNLHSRDHAAFFPLDAPRKRGGTRISS